jgi:hypothetical protein
MLTKHTPQAKLTTVASFSDHYFLENLAVRADGSILVSVLNRKELWCVPSPTADLPAEPVLMHTFGLSPMCIVEAKPDIFYVGTSDIYASHVSYLNRIDMHGWTPGMTLDPRAVLEFPEPRRALNGGCMIAPNVMLVADCFAGLIWRVDLPTDGAKVTARPWLKHDSMDYYPGSMKPEQPGVNGVRYASRTNYLYYTSTAKKLFMRVRVDPDTHEPAGEPEFVAGGGMFDDFCIDEDGGVAYVTTHRENTIDCVSLEMNGSSHMRHSVAGEPLNKQLLGPSSGVWGRGPGEYGRVAYFTTDGGITAPPPDGIVRPAKVLRVEF